MPYRYEANTEAARERNRRRIGGWRCSVSSGHCARSSRCPFERILLANVRLSAIRKLPTEAATNGVLAPEVAAAVSCASGAERHASGRRNWLTLDQAERLLHLADSKTDKGQALAVCSPYLWAALCAGRRSPGCGSKISISTTAAGTLWTWRGREAVWYHSLASWRKLTWNSAVR